MQLKKGSAGFQPAAVGILPAAAGAWSAHRCVNRITRMGRRQDAGSNGLEARAPLPPGEKLEVLRLRSVPPPPARKSA